MEKDKRVCLGGPGWADMSPEVLALIFVRIPSDKMSRTVPQVCCGWREAAVGAYCWEDIDIEKWCRRVGSSLSNKVEVIDPTVRKLIRRSLSSCRSLSAYRVGDSCFPAIASTGKFLTSLQIPMSEVTDAMVEKHAPSLTALTELDISYCLNITFRGLEALGKHCKCLVQLKRSIPLPEFDWSQPRHFKMEVEDGEAMSMAQTMPNLQHLELHVKLQQKYQPLSPCRWFRVRICLIQIQFSQVKRSQKNALQLQCPIVLEMIEDAVRVVMIDPMNLSKRS